MNKKLEQLLPLVKMYQYVSFDLFDTLIYRQKISYPEILELSGKYALSNIGINRIDGNIQKIISDRFYISRLLKGSSKYNTEEPSCDLTIKSLLTGMVNENEIDQIIDKVINFELLLENISLKVIPGMRRFLQLLNQNGNRLIIISDMYFRKSQIETLLDSLSIQHFFKKIYVSSDEGFTKQTGNLYLRALRDLNLDKKDIVHIGDNFTSDIEIPKKLGIKTIYFKHRLGASPLINRPTQYRKIDSIKELVDKLIGPIALTYFLEVLFACRYYRAKKLFFLSRDATLFYTVFLKLQQKDSWVNRYFGDIDVSELAVSRATSLFLGVSTKGNPLGEIAEYYLRKYRNRLTLSDILIHLDIDDNCIDSTFKCRRLSLRNYTEVVEEFYQKHPEYKLKVSSKVKEKQEIIWAYLRQQGALSNGPVIFADIGYSGTVGKNISDYLYREGNSKERHYTQIEVLLLATNRRFVKNANATGRHVKINKGLLFHDKNLHESLVNNYCWLEIFFKDDTLGVLRGYKESRNDINPSFDSTPNIRENIANQLIRDYIVREIQKPEVLRRLTKGNQAHLVRMTRKTFTKPSRNLIDILLGFRQEDIPFANDTHSILYTTSWYRIPFHLVKIIREDYWINGSLVHNGWSFLVWIHTPLMKIYRNARKLAKTTRKAKNLIRKLVYAASSL